MEVIYLENMGIEEYRFVSNVSKFEFGDQTLCMVNKTDYECFVAFLRNGNQFFAIDNLPMVIDEKVDDLYQMATKFIQYNTEVYVSFEYLVEKYLEYLFSM